MKKDIKSFNLKDSTTLSGNQKALRYFASHTDYGRKFSILKKGENADDTR